MDIMTCSHQVRDETVLRHLGDLVSSAFQAAKLHQLIANIAAKKTCFFPWVERPTDSHQCQQTQFCWAKDFVELFILEYNHKYGPWQF